MDICGLTRWLALLLAALLFTLSAAACGSPESTDIVPATATTTSADGENATETEEGSPTEVASAVGEEAAAEDAAAEADMSAQRVATAVSARSPLPTPTPDAIEREIETIASETGVVGRSFFGISAQDWINTLVSVLIILVGYGVIRLLAVLIPKFIGRLIPALDDEFLDILTKYVNWLLLATLVRYALFRLNYLSDAWRTGIQEFYLLVILGIGTGFALELINYAARGYEDRLESADERRSFGPAITAVKRVAQSMVIVVAFSILINQLGFSVSVVAAVVIVSGFVVSFGAQDLLKDVISGFIILTDQPFRAGDAVWIQELDAMGTVLEIGSRSTRIKTNDNREVIMPNSRIGRGQVVNFSYPDPTFRAQTEVGVAFGTDPEKMRRVIEHAVRSVEGVLDDRPVDILFVEFGGSTRLIRVRWWLASRRGKTRSLDKVNMALELALAEAGIDRPYDTYDLNLKTENGITIGSTTDIER